MLSVNGTADPAMKASLADRYDALLLDLDGVVYRGDRSVPGAGEALSAIRRRGSRLLYLTNNSARTPGQVAERLQGLGIEARPEEILTSAQATAAMLQREPDIPRTAFVIGERGIREALEEIGVRLVDGDPEEADVVVVGWDRGLDYGKLRSAALLVQRGARLIGTNPDLSYPATDGLWPGAGALLAAVVATTGMQPVIVGKPAAPMFEAAAARTGARHPLMVGDRLDTDIAGAGDVGWDSLLVLSGASTRTDLLTARRLPTYLGRDLRVLLEDRPAARPRPAIQSDVTAIERLLERAGLSATEAAAHFQESLVLEGDHGGALATAAVHDQDGFGILRSVAVRDDLREAGLGALAVAAAVGQARSRGLAAIAAFTETAAPFFQRLGFRVVERSELPEPIAASPHGVQECPAGTALLLELPGATS